MGLEEIDPLQIILMAFVAISFLVKLIGPIFKKKEEPQNLRKKAPQVKIPEVAYDTRYEDIEEEDDLAVDTSITDLDEQEFLETTEAKNSQSSKEYFPERNSVYESSAAADEKNESIWSDNNVFEQVFDYDTPVKKKVVEPEKKISAAQKQLAVSKTGPLEHIIRNYSTEQAALIFHELFERKYK